MSPTSLSTAVQGPVAALPDEIADLFALDVQTGPVHELPLSMGTDTCTDDTCTQSCVGCGGGGGSDDD